MLIYIIILLILIIQFNINHINNNYNFKDIINNIQNPYLQSIKLLCERLYITNIIEYSIKISSNNINNKREIIICKLYYKNDIINFIQYINLSEKIKNFIYKCLINEDNNYKNYELIFGNDNNIHKIYIYIPTEHIIYGLEYNNNIYYNRYYEEQITNKFPIQLLQKLLKNNNKITDIINCLKTLPNNIKIFKKFNHKNIYEALHIGYNKLLIREYISQIKNLLHIIENKNKIIINNWIEANINKNIYLIGITYKNNNINITFYYR